jgi:hypothetical protein
MSRKRQERARAFLPKAFPTCNTSKPLAFPRPTARHFRLNKLALTQTAQSPKTLIEVTPLFR